MGQPIVVNWNLHVRSTMSAMEYKGELAVQRTNFTVTMVLTNSRKFWRIIKPSPQDSIKLNDDEDNPITGSLWTDVFNSAFANIFTCDPHIAPAISHRCNSPPMPDIIISPECVASIIEPLKLSSSTAPHPPALTQRSSK